LTTRSHIIGCLFAALTVLLVATGSATSQTLAPVFEQRLDRMSQTSADSLVQIVVFLENDVAQRVSTVVKNPHLRRDQKIKSVISEVQSLNLPHAAGIKRALDRISQTAVKRIWIVPAFTATVRLSQLEEIAALDGVRLVTADAEMNYEAPVEVSDAPSLVTAVSGALELLNVPALWAQGLKGSGRLVCSFDTGVERAHPALADKWRGNHEPLSSAWFSKVSPNEEPSDRSGHGTHTMGIMVGAAPSDSFGVAPEAEWITAGVVDQGRPLSTTLSDILEAFQWTLNPDGDTATTDDVPDVISNSWGVPQGLFTPCDETFAEVIEVVEAAGIVTIFAAGNEGPDPTSLRYPADLASSPTSAFAVGAVGYDGLIAPFSSRGPSSCNGAIKPEVVAPGVQIRSCTKDDSYAYMQGTSQAAPFIAGLVALMRQYNPEATVEQIKYALIQAAVDGGTPGEDNEYGYGLVDASKLLDFLPVPGDVSVTLVGAEVLGEDIPEPGSTVQLNISLATPTGNITSLTGRLAAVDTGLARVLADEAEFSFGLTSTAVSTTPYTVSFDPEMAHGMSVEFALTLAFIGGEVLDSMTFELMVGIAPEGLIITHHTGLIDFSVSDFGQYGLAGGSIYNAGGVGFRYAGGGNLLYEAGVLVGRNAIQLSSAVRDSLGDFRPSDFIATESLKDSDGDGIRHTLAEFDDNYSEIPIPLGIVQDVMSFNEAEDLLILRFGLENQSIERLTNLHFGFLADFDLGDEAEWIVYDSDVEMLYQRSADGPMVGLVPLMNVSSFKALANGTDKTGFTNAELFEMISNGHTDVSPDLQGDVMLLVATEAFSIDPGLAVEVAFALIAGDDVSALANSAQRARQLFDMATDIDFGSSDALPRTAVLHQNYPNPFNPATTISFTLERTTDVHVEIYNALGQTVRTLQTGPLSAGLHSMLWNGTDAQGSPVASGVYFYRMTAGDEVLSKKMLLLK